MTEHNFLTLEYWTFTRDDRSKNGVPSQANAATGFQGGGAIMPTALLLRALPDITSGLEVRQIFKVQTVQKPDIFLPGR